MSIIYLMFSLSRATFRCQLNSNSFWLQHLPVTFGYEVGNEDLFKHTYVNTALKGAFQYGRWSDSERS